MRYIIEGKRYPSVTELLKYGGKYDFNDIPKYTLERKAYIGSAVHKAIELFNEGKINERTVDVKIKGYYDAWKSFVEVFGFKVMASELLVVSKKHRYAGTIDSIGKVQGKVILLDTKTSVKVTEASGLQTSAYQEAIEEMKVAKIAERWVIQLKPNGKFVVNKMHNGNDLKHFLEIVDKYYKENGNGRSNTESTDPY